MQLKQAHVTAASAEAKVVTSVGLLDPSETTPILPGASVTLRTAFNPPVGLSAQEFIATWGKMVLHVAYDGTTDEVQISEDMTRALCGNFRPDPLEPIVTPAKSELKFSAEKESLFQLAAKDRRAAIKKSWELLAKDILWAGNVGMERSDPDSPAMSHALRRLESSTTYPL